MSLVLSSRRAMEMAGAVVAGGVSAALFAAALSHGGTGLVFLAYIAGLPLFLAGLAAGSVAAAAASIAGVAGLYFSEVNALTLVYGIFNALPAVILAALAMHSRADQKGQTQWCPEGFIITALALYPSLVFVICAGLTWDMDGGLQAMTATAMHTVVELIKDKADEATLVQINGMVDFFARYMPSMAGCTWMIIMMLCMVGAQKILAAVKLNKRSNFSLQSLQMPSWMIFGVAITGVASMVAPAPFDYLGANVAIMLGMPFFFTGLAIVHAWAGTHKYQKLTLTLFYIVISLVVWSVLVVAALGVIDQWVNFRQRFAIRSKSNIT